MGICASNIGTTTLEPASPQEEGQQKFTGASRASLKQPVEKQPIAPRTSEKLEDQKPNSDPTQQGQNGSAAKPNDESSKDPSKRTTAAASNNQQQPNGDFKISFSEQGDKYINVQKWLSECQLNDKTPNPIMPIGGVIVHNMPTPEEMAKIGLLNNMNNSSGNNLIGNSDNNPSTQVSTKLEDHNAVGLKRHKSMMPSTKQYQIS